jgi:hypothetical protein
MCDYSLMGIPNRLAEEGEDLVAHRFPTGSVGFASPRDLWINRSAAGSTPGALVEATNLLQSAQTKPGSGGLCPTGCPPGVARYSQAPPA